MIEDPINYNRQIAIMLKFEKGNEVHEQKKIEVQSGVQTDDLGKNQN